MHLRILFNKCLRIVQEPSSRSARASVRVVTLHFRFPDCWFIRGGRWETVIPQPRSPAPSSWCHASFSSCSCSVLNESLNDVKITPKISVRLENVRKMKVWRWGLPPPLSRSLSLILFLSPPPITLKNRLKSCSARFHTVNICQVLALPGSRETTSLFMQIV